MSTKGGPKPKPTAIKIASGTLRARDQVASQPIGELLTAIPDAPESLGDVGRAKWEQWGKQLAALKLLETRYLDALEMYCRAWDALARHEAVIEENGGEYFTTDKGFICRHPAATAAKQARDEIRRYQTEFGLTPSSSTSVRVTSKTDGTDKRKRFFEKRA